MRSSAALAVWPSCFGHFSPATQAQRSGPRGAWIATTARWPGSLCRARLGIISVSLTLFPSSPGIVKAQRRADGANPCQNRQGRFREQHTGKNGIEKPPDKVDVPGNLAFSVHSCVGSRCHSSARFVQLCLTAGWLAAYGYQTDNLPDWSKVCSIQTEPLRAGTSGLLRTEDSPPTPQPLRSYELVQEQGQ